MVLFWPQQFRNESRGQMPTGRQAKKDFCAFLKWEYLGMLICLYDNCLWAEHFLLLCHWFYFYQHTYTWVLKTSALTRIPCENNPKCICIVPVSSTELFARIAYLLVFCKTDVQCGKREGKKGQKWQRWKCYINLGVELVVKWSPFCLLPACIWCHCLVMWARVLSGSVLFWVT